MRVETFEELVTPRGQHLLDEITERAGLETDLALGTRLRRTHDHDLVAAAVTQAHLRGKARTKFGDDAARMYFTHDALEQATRSSVAVHRAARLVDQGARSVIDLGCGIGGDLIALARAGLEVEGVELDEVRVRIAAANLAALRLSGIVRTGDATATDLRGDQTAFVDPARRDGSKRVFDPRACVPDWSFVIDLLTRSAAAKMMPGIDHDIIPADVEGEWVSDRGDLVEACLWGRPLATAKHRATLLPSGATVTEADDPGDTTTRVPGRYLYEPDDAVIRAGLVTSVCAQVDGWLIDPHLAYVSSDAPVETPFARAFEVIDELPFRERPMRAALRARDIGTLTIKKRGVQVVPEQLVKRLGLKGSRTATAIMTRVDGAGRAYLVEPLG